VLGCLVAGSLIVLLFFVVPFPLWPFLIVGLVLLLIVSAVFGVLQRLIGLLFGRH
jgi:hypothetical protein